MLLFSSRCLFALWCKSAVSPEPSTFSSRPGQMVWELEGPDPAYPRKSQTESGPSSPSECICSPHLCRCAPMISWAHLSKQGKSGFEGPDPELEFLGHAGLKEHVTCCPTASTHKDNRKHTFHPIKQIRCARTQSSTVDPLHLKTPIGEITHYN